VIQVSRQSIFFSIIIWQKLFSHLNWFI
jgi:hypothetical protein